MDGDLRLPPSLSTIRALVRAILLLKYFIFIYCQENFHFFPRLLDTTDQVQGAQSGKRSEEGNFNSRHVEQPSIFQSSQQEGKLFICALSSCKSKGICFKKYSILTKAKFHTG